LIIRPVSPIFGHAYEKVCADCVARWHRLLGKKVFFLTGTDEYGTKIQRAAKQAGKDPKKFVDEMVVHFEAMDKALNVKYDRFIRTTDADHVKVCKDIFQKLYDKGDIYLGEYSGWYCPECETFYTEKDLVDGNCPTHKKKPEWVKEESYFFKMSKYQDLVLKKLKEKDSIIPPGRAKEIINRIEDGLQDLSVSRVNVFWSIPVPFDKKHFQYVWTTALLNYVTGAGYGTKNFDKIWPADYHFIGPDILWHHTAIWYSILAAAEIPLPKTVSVHGWITFGGEKMSKSRGAVVDPIEISEKHGSDAIRYYLLREVPFGQNGSFTEEALVRRVNNELANELGNLVNRTIVMIEKYSKGEIPKGEADKRLQKKLNLGEITELMDKLELHHALAEIFSFVSACNQFINEKEPWKLQGEEQAAVLYSLADSLRIIAILLYAFMPGTAKKINQQLGISLGKIADCEFNKLKAGTKVKKAGILFKKIE